MNETTWEIPFALTDTGASLWFAHEFANTLKYVEGWGWTHYTGTRWILEPAAGVQHVQKLIRIMYKTASKIEDKDQRQRLAQFATSCESATRIRAIAFLAQHHPRINVQPDCFDADPWLFNTLTGTIGLRTGELKKHSPADLITKLSPVAYDPAATAPTFQRFIGEILAPEDLLEYVQRLFGMCLTGDIREQHLWILWGPGANGKSTLMDLLAYVMGDYFGLAPESLLIHKNRDEHPTELADLQGKRIVLASETDKNARLKLQLVKRLTGDARIKGRRMRQDFYEFNRMHKLFIQSNNRPCVREDTHAMWRRLRLIPFTVTIPEERCDKTLPEKLKAEAPGVLAWLVFGCLAWQHDGVTDPPAVRAATDKYREESNVLTDFVEECCTLGKDEWASTKDLYVRYAAYAKEAGEQHPMDKKNFAESLATESTAGRLPIHPKPRHQGRGWAGITLKDLFSHQEA